MSKKPSLHQLNKDLNKVSVKPEPSKSKAERKTIEANAPRGERANFLKLTITMPPEMLASLRDCGMQRKTEGHKDTDTSALIREAVSEWLKRQ